MKRTLVVFIILIFSISIFADLKKGLVAYYSFNGNAKDESGNGNNGKVHGAILTTDRFGNENSAYYFDGKNDYINCGSNKIFDISEEITISAWINVKSFDNCTLFSKWKSESGGQGSWVLEVNEQGYPVFAVSGNGTDGGFRATSSEKIKLNNYYFITGQYSRTDNMIRIFINGKQKGSCQGQKGSIFISNSKIYIGAKIYKLAKDYCNCIIDDVRFFSRALSESEICDLYLKNSRSKQKFPPDLYIENLRFTEPSKNNALDGLEEGNIIIDIVNKGRGNAYDIEIDITPITSSKNLSYETKTKLDKIQKKNRQKISIPISADIEVENMLREFRIELSENYGFDADPAKISFETMSFAAPDLRIEQIAIDDNDDKEGEGFSYGNGNSIIEPNESIEVTAFVQNFGEGIANDVKTEVILTTANRDITYPDEGKIFNLGDIESGDYKKVEFYFYTSRRYDEKNIPISMKLSENTGKFGKTADLGLKLGDRTKNIVDVQVAKIQKKKKTEMKKLDNLIVLSDVDKDIPKTKVDGKNTLAIIVGIEDYKYAPSVDFASNDARIFYQYAKSVFGIPERNIYYRINDGATSGEFYKIFADDGWIARRLKENKTQIIVYYSGHGAPDTKSEKGYLIPYDIDPNYANTGISLDFIYTSLSKLQAKSVTMFVDACFSGESRSEEMLVAGIRPISVKIRNPILASENMSVFSASTGEQYSSSYPDKQHGLFTYYLLKGLKGEAKGSDGIITLDELQHYIYENVSQTAGYLDKEQNPTFIGKDKNRVLLKF